MTLLAKSCPSFKYIGINSYIRIWDAMTINCTSLISSVYLFTSIIFQYAKESSYIKVKKIPMLKKTKECYVIRHTDHTIINVDKIKTRRSLASNL